MLESVLALCSSIFIVFYCLIKHEKNSVGFQCGILFKAVISRGILGQTTSFSLNASSCLLKDGFIISTSWCFEHVQDWKSDPTKTPGTCPRSCATLKSNFQDTLNFSPSSLPQAATLAVCIDLGNVDRHHQNVQRSICSNTSCYGYKVSLSSFCLPPFLLVVGCRFLNGTFSPFSTFLSLFRKLFPCSTLLSCCVMWRVAQLDVWFEFCFANTSWKLHFCNFLIAAFAQVLPH